MNTKEKEKILKKLKSSEGQIFIRSLIGIRDTLWLQELRDECENINTVEDFLQLTTGEKI